MALHMSNTIYNKDNILLGYFILIDTKTLKKLKFLFFLAIINNLPDVFNYFLFLFEAIIITIS